MMPQEFDRPEIIFDPISNSALVRQGDQVDYVAGPFASRQDAIAKISATPHLQPRLPTLVVIANRSAR